MTEPAKKDAPADHPAVAALVERFADVAFDPRDSAGGGRGVGVVTVTVPADRLIDVMTFLRDDPRTAFDLLVDVTCVDYLNYPRPQPGRFGVTYGLLSTRLNHRLWLKVFVGEDGRVPSVTGLWRGAGWPEREVFDMFGVVFDGHPDPRRILTAPGFKHHPLRKDYPVTGLGERESLAIVKREDA